MNYLNDKHLDKFRSSAIPEDYIKSSEAESIDLKTILDKGFKAPTPDKKESLLQEKYIDSALYLPFFDIQGNKIYDNKTGKEVGIVRLDYTEEAIKKFTKPPKYLNLPQSVQSRFYLHFPKGFNWLEYIENQKELEADEAKGHIAITEGILKSISATANGYPTVGLASVYCFSENGLNTPLIPELKELLRKPNIKFSVLFDGDKYRKLSVANAELALIEKAYLETGVRLNVIDLPQEENCKGLDDFIFVKGTEALKNLKPRSIDTPILKEFKFKQIPQIPKESLPDIYLACIEDAERNIESCIEAVPMVLFIQGAGFIGNKAKINGKLPHLYAETLAMTTGGKTTAAKRYSYPLIFINKSMEKEYLSKLQAGEENIKSEELMISSFTQQGLEHTLPLRKHPVLVMLETSEFENFYALLNAEYNSSLSSFITKAYDGTPIIPIHSKDNLKNSLKLSTIYDPALSIAGVHTFASMQSSKPKGHRETGFDNRFMKFIGKSRKEIRIPDIKAIPSKLEERLLAVYRLVHNYFRSLDTALEFKYSPLAKEMYNRFYNQYKDFEDQHEDDPILPYMRRAVCDFLPKLSLQFEIIERAELIVNNFPEDEHSERFKDSLAADKLFISEAVILKAIYWSVYFIKTAKYIISYYYDSDSDFDTKTEKITNKLKDFPLGIQATSLRREAGMHRKGSTAKEFYEVLDYLEDMNTISIQHDPNNRKSKKVFLRKHLITEAHSEA